MQAPVAFSATHGDGTVGYCTRSLEPDHSEAMRYSSAPSAAQLGALPPPGPGGGTSSRPLLTDPPGLVCFRRRSRADVRAGRRGRRAKARLEAVAAVHGRRGDLALRAAMPRRRARWGWRRLYVNRRHTPTDAVDLCRLRGNVAAAFAPQPHAKPRDYGGILLSGSGALSIHSVLTVRIAQTARRRRFCCRCRRRRSMRRSGCSRARAWTRCAQCCSSCWRRLSRTLTSKSFKPSCLCCSRHATATRPCETRVPMYAHARFWKLQQRSCSGA